MQPEPIDWGRGSGMVRPLGTFEQFFSARHSLGLHKGVITVCRYAVPTTLAEGGDGQQARERERERERVRARVEAALAVVVGRLGALRAGIAAEDTRRPRFVAVGALDLRAHVEWRAADDDDRRPGRETEAAAAAAAYDRWLERELEAESGRPWDDLATRPPWRLLGFFPGGVAGHHVDLAFAVHHALADGKSGQVFHAHLVEALGEGEGEGEGDDDRQSPQQPVLTFDGLPLLAPPQEHLLRFTVSWAFFARTLWAELGPAWLKRAVALLVSGWSSSSSSASRPAVVPYTGDQPIVLALSPTRVRLLSVAAVDVGALLTACRVHGTTLTPLLHGLLLAAAARRAATAATFSGSTPVSLRSHVTRANSQPDVQGARGNLVTTPAGQPDVQRALGNFVTTHRHVFSADVVQGLRQDGQAAEEGGPTSPDAALWRAVAEMDVGLRACTADVTRDSVLGLLAWVGDWHAWFRGKAGKPRPDTWEVSNVGAVDDGGGGRRDGWRLTRALFTFTAPPTGPLLEITASSVRGGPLVLAMVRQPGSAEEERFCEAVWADLHASLARFAETGRFLGERRGGEASRSVE